MYVYNIHVCICICVFSSVLHVEADMKKEDGYHDECKQNQQNTEKAHCSTNK